MHLPTPLNRSVSTDDSRLTDYGLPTPVSADQDAFNFPVRNKRLQSKRSSSLSMADHLPPAAFDSGNHDPASPAHQHDFIEGSSHEPLPTIPTNETISVSDWRKEKRRSFDLRPLRLSQHPLSRTVSEEHSPHHLPPLSANSSPGAPPSQGRRSQNRRSLQFQVPSSDRRAPSTSSTRQDYFSHTHSRRESYHYHSRRESFHSRLESTKSPQESTTPCGQCELLGHRVEQLEKALDVCVEGAASALEIERSLRLEIEERVLELLVEISKLKAAAKAVAPDATVLQEEDTEEDDADSDYDRTIRTTVHKRPKIWNWKSEDHSTWKSTTQHSPPSNAARPRRRNSQPNLTVPNLAAQNPNRRSFLATTLTMTLSQSQPGESTLRSSDLKSVSSTFVDTTANYNFERDANLSETFFEPDHSLPVRPSTSPPSSRSTLSQSFMRRASQRIVGGVASLFMGNSLNHFPRYDDRLISPDTSLVL